MTLIKHRLATDSFMNCPNCKKGIRYCLFGGMGLVYPHFYCNKCSSVLFRENDRALVMNSVVSQELFENIVATLPACPCGGNFSPDAFPPCPHCNFKYESNSDPIARLTDPYAIVIQGAYYYTESIRKSSYIKQLIVRIFN